MTIVEKIEMAKKASFEEFGEAEMMDDGWKKEVAGGFCKYWKPGVKRSTFFMTHVASRGLNVYGYGNNLIGQAIIY